MSEKRVTQGRASPLGGLVGVGLALAGSCRGCGFRGTLPRPPLLLLGFGVLPLPRLPASFRGRPAEGAGSPHGAADRNAVCPKVMAPKRARQPGREFRAAFGLRPRRGRGRRLRPEIRSQWARREARGRGHTVGAATGLRAQREGARRRPAVPHHPERGAGATQVTGRGRGRRSRAAGAAGRALSRFAPPPPCGRDLTSALTSRRQVRRPLPGSPGRPRHQVGGSL